MADEFRVEIPIEVVDNTGAGLASAQALEKVLQQLQATAKSAGQAASSAMNTISGPAESAASSIEDVEESLKDSGNAGKTVGSAAASGFQQAGAQADQFTQRVEKSNKSLRDAFKEKIQLTMEALDKASPVITTVMNQAKKFGSKGIEVAVRMKDMITAPIKKVLQLVANPITMAASAAGIGMGFKDMLDTHNSFQSGMSAVKAITRADNEEFARLTETAKHLGETTAFSAAQASEGMQNLGMAGFAVNDIIDAMPALLDLSAAGGTDLARSAEIVADTLRGIGMEAGEASKAADIFARTATSTNTSVDMLGETMKYAAPIAKTFGLDLADISAAAGLMANAGIKSTQAGTALRSSLLRMSKPTKEMQKAMKQLGVSFTDDGGKMKSMSGIIKMLEGSFGKLTESEKLENAQILFGTEAASAWLALIDQGSDKYDELNDSLHNSTGAAKEMADTRLDNLAGDITILNSALEGAKLSIMEQLDPYLRKGVQWLTSQIPNLTEAAVSLADTVIEKAKSAAQAVTEFFQSADWQNADGFTEKAAAIWDNLIAAPLSEWWNTSGRGKVHSIVGAVWNEIMSFFGEVAGRAPEFIGSLFGNLFNFDETSVFSAVLLGKGAAAIGRTAGGIAKGVKEIKTSFDLVHGASVTAASGVGTSVTAFGALKSVVSAIPVWGWVAAAAITAVGIGIKVYNDKMEEHRQKLLHFGDSVEAATSDFNEAAQKVQDLNSLNAERKELETIISVAREGLTDDEIEALRNELDGIDGDIAILTAWFIDIGFDDFETVEDYAKRFNEIEGGEKELTAKVEATVNDQAKAEQVLTLMKDYANAHLPAVSFSYAKSEIEALVNDKEKAEQVLKLMQDYNNADLPAVDINYVRSELVAILGDKEKAEQLLALMQQYGNANLPTHDLNYIKAQLYAICDSPEQAEELLPLFEDYSELESKSATLTASLTTDLPEGTDVATVVDKLKELGTLIAERDDIELKLTAANLSEEELNAYEERYKEVVQSISEMSGGLISANEADAAALNSKIPILQAQLSLEKEIARLRMQATIEEGRGLIGKQVESRAGFISKRDEAYAAAQTEIDRTENLESLKSEFLSLMNAPESEMYTDAWNEAMAANAEAFTRATGYDQSARMDLFGNPYALPEYLEDALTRSQEYTSRAAQYQADYEQQNAALRQQYEGEKSLIAQNAFAGTAYEGQSMEQIASQYSSFMHSSELRGAYEDMVSQLDALNTTMEGQGVFNDDLTATTVSALQELVDSSFGEPQAGADTESQKVNVEKAMSDLAALNRLEGGDTGYTRELKAAEEKYKSASTEEEKQAALTEWQGVQSNMAASMESGYAALEELDAQIEAKKAEIEAANALVESGEGSADAVSELQGQLVELQAMKVDTITLIGNSLDTVAFNADRISKAGLSDALKVPQGAQESFTNLGSKIGDARQKAQDLKNEINAIKGNYDVSFSVRWNFKTPQFPTGGGEVYSAAGRITDKAMLSWIGEDGPEAVIPLSDKYKSRGIELWQEAGERLGMFDEGMVASSENTGGSGYNVSGLSFESEGGNGTTVINLNVQADATYEVNGESGDIMEQLAGHEQDFVERIAGELVERIEDIRTNPA